MRRTRSKQIMTIAVIMVAVVGLAVGFAAFSASLTIQPGADVTPDASDFVVRFSSSATEYSEGLLTPTFSFVSPATKNATLPEGVEGAKINNVATNGPEIENLTVQFTEPGQTVAYTFYVRNDGKYDAYLQNIDFGTKSCTAGANAPQTGLMEQACGDIDVKISFGDNALCSYSEDSGYGCGNDGITKGNFSKITVVITYDSNGTRVDGDFNVNFGDIKLTYSTVMNFTPTVS